MTYWDLCKATEAKKQEVLKKFGKALKGPGGFLFINNDPVGRIAPKLPKVAYSEEAAYWEGRILSRQED